MSYFEKIPNIYYHFKTGGIDELRVVKDLTFNVRPLKDVLENITLFEDYDIQDGDTPEIISERVYGSPLYHWVIMLINEKYHYQNDWPIPDHLFDEYVEKKYGVGNSYDIHVIYGRDHYVSPKGHVVDSNAPLAEPVTNYEYEFLENNKKRRIRLISPQLIGVFMKDLEEAASRG